jgi:hypothetical protein
MSSPFAIDWLATFGGVASLAAVTLLVLVVAPWKRDRGPDGALDVETQARLLSGEDPDEIDGTAND